MAKFVNNFGNFVAPLWKKVQRRELFGFGRFTDKILSNSRLIWKYVVQRTAKRRGRQPEWSKSVAVAPQQVPRQVLKEQSIAPFRQHVSIPRQIFTNVFPRVRVETQAAGWRRRAAIYLASFRTGSRRGASLLGLMSFALVEEPHFNKERRDLFAKIRELHALKLEERENETDGSNMNLSLLEFGNLIDLGCHAAVYEAKYVEDGDEAGHKRALETSPSLSDGHFNLAVKMMFNYDTESNSDAILQVMKKEGVPYLLHQDLEELGQGTKTRSDGSAHPNIVAMYDVFEDQIPDLPENLFHYPAALPTRINPDGFGRNSTMFLVMKRYDCTLSNYLSQNDPSMASRCLMFTQLLEGILYLQKHGIAHRDLKTDNILLDLSHGEDCPLLVITDFGCCLFKEAGLSIPYVTQEISKGGNAALMAPEIACARVGNYAMLDYNKADLWTVGALAYELFGADNPFYRSKHNPHHLDSRTYRPEDLPPLPVDVPDVVQSLVRNLLSRDVVERVRCSVAASVMQLMMWMPRQWMEFHTSINLLMVQQWLVIFTAQLYRQVINNPNDVSNNVKQIFLSRISDRDFKDAYNFIHASNKM